MHKFLTSLVVATLGWVPLASAQSSMVVVELYTSQGCSSCPAADMILNELSGEDDIIALGLHVDYWDYLGWQDKLAQHKFTKRQEIYNAVLKSRYRLVTPQMIMQGRDHVAGAKRRKVLEYIEMLRKMPEGAVLDITRSGEKMQITFGPLEGQNAGESVLHVVRFTPGIEVAIKGGENSGRKIQYTNTVTDWQTIAKWDGHEQVKLDHNIADGEHVAVILQAKNNGPILVARRLD